MAREKGPSPEKKVGQNLVKVAELGEIEPGQRKLISIRGLEIIVFNIDGDFYAITNRCPHEDYPLNYGPLYGDIIMCPNHAWMFNVKTGRCMTKSSHPVKTYRVLVQDKSIKVEL